MESSHRRRSIKVGGSLIPILLLIFLLTWTLFMLHSLSDSSNTDRTHSYRTTNIHKMSSPCDCDCEGINFGSIPKERRQYLRSLLSNLSLGANAAAQERRDNFNKIYKDKVWSDGESLSGPGSFMGYTKNVRLLLAKVISDLHIQTLIDAPSGDCNWQPSILGFENIQYTGLDIVSSVIEGNKIKFASKPNMNFHTMDFSIQPLPFAADAVLTRDMIQHNTLEAGVRTYINIEASGSTYLITNWHQSHHNPNRNIQPGDFFLVNPFFPPFNFSKPLFWIREGDNGQNSEGKHVGVWKLPVVGMGDGIGFDISPDVAQRANTQVIQVE